MTYKVVLENSLEDLLVLWDYTVYYNNAIVGYESGYEYPEDAKRDAEIDIEYHRKQRKALESFSREQREYEYDD